MAGSVETTCHNKEAQWIKTILWIGTYELKTERVPVKLFLNLLCVRGSICIFVYFALCEALCSRTCRLKELRE